MTVMVSWGIDVHGMDTLDDQLIACSHDVIVCHSKSLLQNPFVCHLACAVQVCVGQKD